ncbi:hypothetical protein [Embleya sp. NPDC005575]|uniref:hypothetical protein n=1 Tax=Embleya sp. NPDC005575 TaxID=3156892 RepID=UPI0033A4733E
MPRRVRPLSEYYGDLVRAALIEARPSGLQTRQLVAATRLKPSQVACGVRHLRDVSAAEYLTPIIWGRRHGYVFSDDPADWIEYEKRQSLPAHRGILHHTRTTGRPRPDLPELPVLGNHPGLVSPRRTRS